MSRLSKMPDINEVEKMSGAELLNLAVREVNNPELNKAIGDTTIDSSTFGQIGQIINSNDAWRNQVYYTLFNKVGLYEMGYAVATDKYGALMRDYLSIGGAVDEIEMDKIKPVKYNPEIQWQDALKQYIPKYLEMFHTPNRKERYALTVNPEMAKRAFSSEQAFRRFLDMQFAVAAESNKIDRNYWFWNLFKYVAENIAYYVEIPGFDTKEHAEDTTVLVRQWGLDLLFPSDKFNVAGFTREVSPENIFIIMKNSAKAFQSVKVLATSYHMQETEFIANHTLTVPTWVDLGENVEILMGDINAFRCYVNLYASDFNHNGAVMGDTHFLHVHETYSSSIVYPVIAFKSSTITPSVLGDFKPASNTILNKGDTEMISIPVTSGDNKQVHYTLTGNTAPETQIQPWGLLYVGQNEQASVITVTATIEDGNNGSPVTKSVTYQIRGNTPKFGFVQPQDRSVIKKGEAVQLMASLSEGQAPITYSIITDGVHSGTTITPSGLLTINAAETQPKITIKLQAGVTSTTVEYTIADA